MEKEHMKILSSLLPGIFAFARSRSDSADEAEELAQEIAFQCVLASEHTLHIEDPEKYFRSIAYNTYKRMCVVRRISRERNKYDDDSITNVISDAPTPCEFCIAADERDNIRLAVARLANYYRRVIVCFWFEERSIHETSQLLSISEGMVKFYLRAGKKKLKEIYEMKEIGEKSYNPAEFSVYKSALDFSRVNVWDVFRRKLPAQLALLCHDKPRRIEELSLECGVPAVYLEEELSLLIDAGVVINPSNGKYRTNLHILKKATIEQVREQFVQLWDDYFPEVQGIYEKSLPLLKSCGVFAYDASPDQWAWYFALHVPDFDSDGHNLTREDYPQILSCGSVGFIFAEEANTQRFGCGATPTVLSDCTVLPRDIVAFGEYHCQRELRNDVKAKALRDISLGITPEDQEICAELIEQSYVVKRNGRLYSAVPVTGEKAKQLFADIKVELSPCLKNSSAPIRENIRRIVAASMPEQLRAYINGYTETWIDFYSSVYAREMLWKHGFLRLPENDDNTPLACEIILK